MFWRKKGLEIRWADFSARDNYYDKATGFGLWARDGYNNAPIAYASFCAMPAARGCV